MMQVMNMGNWIGDQCKKIKDGVMDLFTAKENDGINEVYNNENIGGIEMSNKMEKRNKRHNYGRGDNKEKNGGQLEKRSNNLEEDFKDGGKGGYSSENKFSNNRGDIQSEYNDESNKVNINQNEVLTKLEQLCKNNIENAKEICNEIRTSEENIKKEIDTVNKRSNYLNYRDNEDAKKALKSIVAESIGKNIDTIVGKVTNPINSNINQTIKAINEVNKQANSIDLVIKDVSEDVKSIKTITETVNIPEIMQDMQTVVGGVKTLTSEVDSIKKIIVKSTKLPQMDEDEIVIAELSDYGSKIFETLSLAARHYAKNRLELNNLKEAKKNLDNELKKAKEISYKDGLEAGKKAIIKDIIDKFDDKLVLLESYAAEDNRSVGVVNVLKNILMNNGLASKYEVGEEIDFNSERIAELEADISIDDLNEALSVGKIKIVKPQVIFSGNVIQKAEAIAKTASELPQVPEESTECLGEDKLEENVQEDKCHQIAEQQNPEDCNEDNQVEDTIMPSCDEISQQHE